MALPESSAASRIALPTRSIDAAPDSRSAPPSSDCRSSSRASPPLLSRAESEPKEELSIPPIELEPSRLSSPFSLTSPRLNSGPCSIAGKVSRPNGYKCTFVYLYKTPRDLDSRLRRRCGLLARMARCHWLSLVLASAAAQHVPGDRLVVVSGANRGVGLGIARQVAPPEIKLLPSDVRAHRFCTKRAVAQCLPHRRTSLSPPPPGARPGQPGPRRCPCA